MRVGCSVCRWLCYEPQPPLMAGPGHASAQLG